MSSFYAIQVETGKEEYIKELIDSFNLDYVESVFIPKVKRVKNFKGIKKLVDVVMFKGYVIVDCLDPKALYIKLSTIPSLTKLLGKERDMFFPIYDEEVKFLNLILNEKKEVEVSVGYIINEQIVITEGPLAGNEAIIKRIDRHKKTALVEIEFMGNTISATLGLEIISKVNS